MAHRLLFPLAATFALAAPPFWLALRGAHPGMDGALWHGHEMLFGYALAVIAGFLSTRPTRAGTWLHRSGFDDDETHTRQLYRVRYYQRIADT
jgi:uncharacterized protein involved in response to NO